MRGIIDESVFPRYMMEPPNPPTETTCRDHAPCPEGYLPWQEWARLIDKTHNSERCGEWPVDDPPSEETAMTHLNLFLLIAALLLILIWLTPPAANCWIPPNASTRGFYSACWTSSELWS